MEYLKDYRVEIGIFLGLEHIYLQEAGKKVLVEDSKKVEEAAADEAEDQKADKDDKPSTAESTPPKSKKKKKKKGKKKGKDQADDDKSDGKREDDEEKDKESISPDQSVNLEEERFEELSIISELFGMRTNTTLKCRCGQEMEKVSDTTLVNLHYPDCSPPGHNKPPVRFTFAEVVKHSLSLEQNTQAWCNSCEKYQPHMQSKVIRNIPDILALNCGMENIRDLEFWKIQQMLIKQKREEEGSSQSYSMMSSQMPVMCRYGRACTRKGCRFRHETDMKSEIADMPAVNPDEDPDLVWIPFVLKVILGSDGKVDIEELPEDSFRPKYEDPSVKYYDLYATVGHIKDQKNGNTVVSQIFVGETFHQRKEGVTCTQWYLMNDFSITPIEKVRLFNKCSQYNFHIPANYHDLGVNYTMFRFQDHDHY
ncbi:PAB-dependent poly(A)-specific ribonuclease subunit 2 [Mytilus galloprovincialis]|uniref:PAB-dependent poly(A)-specific ribonuclease subunit 2 n=1 Tax=Mytilus galloprovincialis TaxID=29158 RepID=A0A8B6CVM8_MYTGA|nr:PAB-dependent poly(A)-specific ribonuclease subunit 2 [Mytilus galloprovincialis]